MNGDGVADPGSVAGARSSASSLASTAARRGMVPDPPPSDLLRLKNNRVRAEISVQLMANRIALLKAEEERAQRRIRAMNTTVQKVESCQKEEMELKAQLRSARERDQKTVQDTANRIKQESIEARHRLKQRSPWR